MQFAIHDEKLKFKGIYCVIHTYFKCEHALEAPTSVLPLDIT